MKIILNKCLLLPLLVISSLGFLGAVRFRCDYSHSNVGWLKYHEIPATWFDARLRCRFEGGMLASPTTAALKETMTRSIRNVDIFTGIHATFSDGSYTTVDGIPLGKISHIWAKDEPDNKNNAEKCIAMSSEGFFSDVDCSKPRPYMCFRANSEVDTSVCGTADPEYFFETRTNKCYKFHTTPRTFKRAHFVCDAEGGHLAIVNSLVESQVLRDIFAKNPASKITGIGLKGYAFVGFSNWGESADWTTIHGQTLQEAGFTQFPGGQPNNLTGQYCGSVERNGLLDDLWCESHLPFICEKFADYPAVCKSEDFNQDVIYVRPQQ